MKSEYTSLTIVDKDYLQELEQFKKDRDVIYDVKLTYDDIVKIDTYKDAFCKLIKQTHQSIAQQRALNRGKEDELWGAMEGMERLLNIVNNIDKTRAEFDNKKEQ